MKHALTRRPVLALIGVGTAAPLWAACGPGERAVGTTDQQYADAGRRRAAFNQRFHAMLASIDALVCPSNIAALPLVDGMGYDSIGDFGRALASIAERFDPPLGSIQLFTAPADFAGTPTISLPCGFSANGAPHSLQLVGRDLSEATLCRIEHAYEQATG